MTVKREEKSKQKKIQAKNYWTALVVSVMVFAGAAYAAHGGTAGWEGQLFATVNGWSDGLGPIMLAITLLGSEWMAVLCVAVVFILGFYRFTWRLALSIGVAYIFVGLAKAFIGRSRPEGLFEELALRSTEHGMGFPSGHTVLITIIMLTVTPYLPKKWLWVIPIPIILVGISRIYLGVHVPLDIVGGVALATFVVVGLRLLPLSLRTALRIS